MAMKDGAAVLLRKILWEPAGRDVRSFVQEGECEVTLAKALMEGINTLPLTRQDRDPDHVNRHQREPLRREAGNQSKTGVNRERDRRRQERQLDGDGAADRIGPLEPADVLAGQSVRHGQPRDDLHDERRDADAFEPGLELEKFVDSAVAKHPRQDAENQDQMTADPHGRADHMQNKEVGMKRFHVL